MKKFHLWIINFAKLCCVLRFSVFSTEKARGQSSKFMLGTNALNFFFLVPISTRTYQRGSFKFFIKKTCVFRICKFPTSIAMEKEKLTIIEWVKSRHCTIGMTFSITIETFSFLSKICKMIQKKAWREQTC